MSVVVVTGATGDTGRAVCLALRGDGHIVVAVGTNAGRLATVEASSRYVGDVATAAGAAGLAAAVRAEFGPADGVVHLVGGWRGGQADADFDWLETRILGTLRQVTLAFHDDLASSEAGRLVVIGSSAAGRPTWSNANYATVKSAADAWVQAVASGWRKGGTAAAVTLTVKSIGADGTSAQELASRILPLWSAPAGELNGARIDLTAAPATTSKGTTE